MRIAFFLAVFALVGCGASQLKYAPQSSLPADSAIKDVEKLLWEQSPPFSPKAVEVTPEFFKTPAGRGTPGAVYFSSIKQIGIYEKKGIFITMLSDDAGLPIYRYHHRNESKAKQFADAIASLTH